MGIMKVLIVEDSTPDMIRLRDIVADVGCQVTTASNGVEALDMVSKDRPDLIFLDVNMDEMDGFKVCRKLKQDEATKSIDIIFVTSKGQKADRVWARSLGARELIAKPYEEAQIIEALKT